MATLSIVEVGVRAVITITRNADGMARLTVEGASLDAAGTVVRRSQPVDITDAVAQGVRDGAENLMTNIENRLKSQWNI